jgi:predicted aminopeptidase
MALMNQRKPIDKVLADPAADPEVKRKLKLVGQALEFGEQSLGMTKNKNYRTYVDIHRPYVTWIVQASPPYELKAHTWWFPIVGSLPYKGFFTEQEARDEAKKMDPAEFDTYVRGASAFSTLGWFRDPVLSSMLRYQDPDLIETILHESTHATVFVSDHGEFNERMANFFGAKGAELFYEARQDLNTARAIRDENEDHLLFSKWMGKEIEDLKAFYQSHKTAEAKSARLAQFATDFVTQLKPTLRTDRFDDFAKIKLNNAILLNYTTYDQDLSDFAALLKKTGSVAASLAYLKTLVESRDPEGELKKFIQ